METFLKERGVDVRVGKGTGRTPHRGQVLGCCFTTAKETGAEEILFVGTGLFHPIGISLATRTRVIAFDPLAGIAGSLLAHSVGSITTENFPFMDSILYVGMIIIGGLGSIPGAVFGAAFR